MMIVIPVEDCNNKIMATHFGRANYYVLFIVEAGVIKDEKCIENPRYRGAKPGEYFAEMGADIIIISVRSGIGRKAIQELRSRGVRILQVDARNAVEAVEKFLRGNAREYTGDGCSGQRY